MPIHVAILKRPYLQGILDGWKTVESRMYRVAQPPHRCINEGERIFLKVSAGPWMATAVAGRIESFDGVTPETMDHIRAEFGARIGGDEEYWSWKRASRYVTLVHLRDVEPLDVGPVYPKTQRAWHVLDEAVSPLREVAVTAGAIKNRYAIFPKQTVEPDGAELTLHLPDGATVTTVLARGRMLRWRGWGGLYEAAGVGPGSRMRYVAVGRRAYRVSFPGPR